MEDQIMKTSRATNFHLSRINKIRRFLDFSSVKCVVNALVLSRLDYCNALYLNLPFLKRLQRAKLKVACLTLRCFNGSAPLYLFDLISCNAPGRELRSGDKNLLICKPFRLILFGKRAFSCAAPLLWNSLHYLFPLYSSTVHFCVIWQFFKMRVTNKSNLI